MIAVLFVGVFVAVVFAYVATEYAMTRFDVRRQVMVGEAGVLLILAVNCASFLLLWVCASILVVASGYKLFLQISVISIGAQTVWLSQHVWFYYRDHLRVRYE